MKKGQLEAEPEQTPTEGDSGHTDMVDLGRVPSPMAHLVQGLRQPPSRSNRHKYPTGKSLVRPGQSGSESRLAIDRAFEFRRTIDASEKVVLSREGSGAHIHPRVNRQFWVGGVKRDQQVNRYKIRVQRNDFTSLRFQCFCQRHYLSYCSLYQHVRKFHRQFLDQHPRFASTHFLDDTDPVYGYPVRRLSQQQVREKPVRVAVRQAERPPRYTARVECPSREKLQSQYLQLKESLDLEGPVLRTLDLRISKSQQIIAAYERLCSGFEDVLRILGIPAVQRAIKRDKEIEEQFRRWKSGLFLP